LQPQKVVDAVVKTLKSQEHNEVYLPFYASLATKMHRLMGPHLTDFALKVIFLIIHYQIFNANDDMKKFKYSKSAMDSKKEN
jgi:hypothetical protein